MIDKSFDFIFIETGSGGSVAVGKCAKAGWKVAKFLKLLKERNRTLFHVGFVTHEYFCGLRSCQKILYP